MGVLGRYSFPILGVVLLSICLAATWRIRRRWLRAAIPAVLVGVLVTVFLVLRTGAGNVHSVEDLDRALASGKPVLLEMYSDY